jgi:hypothetical protein
MTQQKWSGLVVLLLLLVVQVTAFEIVAQDQTVQVVNGHSRVVHTVTVRCNDANTYNVQLVNGNTSRQVGFQCVAPRYVFRRTKLGFVPKVQYAFQGKMCLMNSVETNTANFTGSFSEIASRRRLLQERQLQTLSWDLKPKTRETRRKLLWDSTDTDAAIGAGGLVAGGGAGWAVKSRLAAGSAAVDAESGVAVAAEGSSIGSLGGGVLVMAATIAVCHFSNWCGGSDAGEISALKSAMAGIQNSLVQLNGTVNSLETWAQGVDTFDNLTAQEIQTSFDNNGVLAAQTNANMEAISALNTQVQGIIATNLQFSEKVAGQMDSLQQELSADISAVDYVWNVTKSLHNQETNVINKLSNMLLSLTRQLRDMDIIMLQMYTDRNMRRSLIGLYHILAQTETTQDTTPFVNDPGVPGISRAAVNGMRNLRNAVSLGSILVQATSNHTGGNTAVQHNITLLCDPIFMLDHIAVGMDFQTIFDYLGPPDCITRNGSGYHDADEPWTCNCVVLRTYKACDMDGGSFLFPWNWTAPVLDVYAYGHNRSHCPNSPSLYTDAGLGSGLDVIMDSYARVTADLGTTICGESVTYGIPGANQAKIRIWSDSFVGRYADLTLSEASMDVMCDMAFMPTATDPAVQVRTFAFNIYTMWTFGYSSLVTQTLPTMEQAIYGRLASGLNLQSRPFNNMNNISQSFRCEGMMFARISDAKLPLYEYQQLGVIKEFGLTVDDLTVLSPATNLSAFAGGGGEVSVALPNSALGGNVSITTDVLVDNSAINVLPAHFMNIGEWMQSEVGEELLYTYDVPFSQLSGNEQAFGRAGQVNYLFEALADSAGDNARINRTTWEAKYRAFHADQLGTDPTIFKRTLALRPASTLTDFVCDQSVNSDGVTASGSVVEHNDWCAVLEKYRVVSSSSDELILEAREWNTEATVTVPGGSFVQTITSACPDGVSIQRVGGDVYITMNTSLPEPESVRVVVSNPQNNSCQLTDQNYAFSRWSPLSLEFLQVTSCQPLFVQVYTLDTMQSCFSGDGVRLSITHSVSGGPGLTGPVQSAIAYAQDTVMSDLVAQINSLADYALQLQVIVNTPDPDASIDDQVAQLLANRTRAAAAMSGFSGAGEEAYKQQLAQINATEAALVAQLNAARAASEAYAKARATEAAQVANIQLINEVVNNATRDLEAHLAALSNSLTVAVNDIQAYLDAKDDSGCSLPSFLSFICTIIDGIGNLFGIGGKIIQFLITMLIIYLLVVFGLPFIMSLIRNCKSSHNKSNSDPREGYPVLHVTSSSQLPASTATATPTTTAAGESDITQAHFAQLFQPVPPTTTVKRQRSASWDSSSSWHTGPIGYAPVNTEADTDPATRVLELTRRPQ